MDFLSKLFGKKASAVQNQSNTNFKTVSSVPPVISRPSPSFHLRGVPDAEGLYPGELVMLAVAEKYSITETKFPGYLAYDYEIINPQKMLNDLYNRGYLKYGNLVDSLPKLKLPELKEIASALAIPVSGKKADIIERLAIVDETQLGNYVSERTWKLTEKGVTELKINPYIEYFLTKHEYDLKQVGVTIWTVNAEYLKYSPKRLFRDIIYRQLDNNANEALMSFFMNSCRGSSDIYNYCECIRVMGLFVEEEGRSYINAMDLYFQYIFECINLRFSTKMLVLYNSGLKNSKQEALNGFYEDIQLVPFQRTELLRIIDKAGIGDDELRQKLVISFGRANKSMRNVTPDDVADFVIYELSGDVENAKKLSLRMAQNMVKNNR